MNKEKGLVVILSHADTIDKKEGYKIILSGTDDYRSGGEIRPLKNGTTDETSKILNT